jgi:hypothetical protein
VLRQRRGHSTAAQLRALAWPNVAPHPSFAFGSRRPLLGQGEVRIRRACVVSTLLEDPDQFLGIADQIAAIRALDALNSALLDVNQHRFPAAFCTRQNVIGRIDLLSPHPSNEPIPHEGHPVVMLSRCHHLKIKTESMKPRHAVALALIAGCGTEPPVVAPELLEWEIMQPPQIEGRPYPTPDETAPLSKWIPADRHTYPTQTECEQALASLRERLQKWAGRVPQFLYEQGSKLNDQRRCVSIDDPNLKSN